MSLLQELDAAWAQNPNPDEIVKLVTDPFMNFIRVADVDENLFRRLGEYAPGICFYNMDTGRWDGSRSVENVSRQGPSRFTAGGLWEEYSRFQRLSRYWAFIGYPHRMRAGLEFPR